MRIIFRLPKGRPNRGALVKRVGIAQMAALALACACGAAGAFVAVHYPLSPIVAVALYGSWIAVVAKWPRIWLFAVPALLPVLGFATWTGWIIFDEFDLLVLGAAAGGYLRLVNRDDAASSMARSTPGLSCMLPVAFGAWSTIALYRGIVDAGASPSGWFDGYYDTLNSLRVFKGFAFAALLLPLLAREQRKESAPAVADLVGAGMAAGCAIASAAVVWERIVFPGFLDFSSDYRVTGPFWEMHVGGAALDGFLALTFPFVVREWLRAHTRMRVLVSVALLLLGGYACLVTFSRGLYAGLLIATGSLVFLLQIEKSSDRKSKHDPRIGTIGIGALVAVTIVTTWLTFGRGGYRAVAAIVGVVAIALPLASELPHVRVSRWLPAGVAGACVSAIGVFAAINFSKGPYLLYAALFAASCAVTWRFRETGDTGASLPAAAAAFFALVVAGVGIALHWGGIGAAGDSIAALALYMALIGGSAASSRPLWPGGLKTGVRILTIVILFSGAVVVFSAGAYMESRFAASQSDLETRFAHWRHVADLLTFPDEWLMGAGLGRLPSRYFYDARGMDFPGSYTIREDNGKRILVVAGPRHARGYGEVLRISQRVAGVSGRMVIVRVVARTERDALLPLEICTKHLLYSAGCIAAVERLKGGPAWQEASFSLNGRDFSSDPFNGSRPMVFSFAAETEGAKIEIANFSAIRDDGVELIANGDFAAGMSRWFFTSDHEHLPWHAKNLFLNILFDEGIVGLALFTAVVALTLGRLMRLTREQRVAPFILASVAGFLVVGVFDSLLDVPRLAFLFYLLLFVGLGVPRYSRASREKDTSS